MVLSRRLQTFWRTGNPTRRLVLVVEVLASEDRFEHAFLIADNELVLDREQQHRDRQEPEHAGNRDESQPDQKVADVERVPRPRKDSVGDQSLHIARATARHRTRRRDTRQADRFADHDQRDPHFPAKGRGGSRHHQRNPEKEKRQPAAMAEQYGADLGGK